MRILSTSPHSHYEHPGLGQRLRTVGGALAVMCLAASVAIVGLTLGFIAATLVAVGLLAAAGAWLTIRAGLHRSESRRHP